MSDAVQLVAIDRTLGTLLDRADLVEEASAYGNTFVNCRNTRLAVYNSSGSDVELTIYAERENIMIKNYGMHQISDLVYTIVAGAFIVINVPTSCYFDPGTEHASEQIVMCGGEDGTYRNDSWITTSSEGWTEKTGAAGWDARISCQLLSYDDALWLIGGLDSGINSKNDVWKSTDRGATWTEVTAEANWSARYGHKCFVFDSKMWLVGGIDGSGHYDDVWYSTDGESWTRAVEHAAFDARGNHGGCVFDSKMWIMGGVGTGASYKNDVYSSSDGVTWTQATASAAWAARSLFGCIAFDSKMWVMGGTFLGTNKNDVYNSEDGATWSLVAASADWETRSQFGCAEKDDLIYVFGGSRMLGEVWTSPDGAAWTQLLDATWSPRQGFAAATVSEPTLTGYSAGETLLEFDDPSDVYIAPVTVYDE